MERGRGVQRADDAEVVMAMCREEVNKRDDPDLKGKANFSILKQRNGPSGDVDPTSPRECPRSVNQERELNPAVPRA